MTTVTRSSFGTIGSPTNQRACSRRRQPSPGTPEPPRADTPTRGRSGKTAGCDVTTAWRALSGHRVGRRCCWSAGAAADRRRFGGRAAERRIRSAGPPQNTFAESVGAFVLGRDDRTLTIRFRELPARCRPLDHVDVVPHARWVVVRVIIILADPPACQQSPEVWRSVRLVLPSRLAGRPLLNSEPVFPGTQVIAPSPVPWSGYLSPDHRTAVINFLLGACEVLAGTRATSPTASLASPSTEGRPRPSSRASQSDFPERPTCDYPALPKRSPAAEKADHSLPTSDRPAQIRKQRPPPHGGRAERRDGNHAEHIARPIDGWRVP